MKTVKYTPEQLKMIALVDRVESEEQLPKGTLRALSGIESSFNPKAKSGTGVVGLLQVTLDTGRPYGLKTNEDRLDPEKSARAGARYYRDLLDTYKGDTGMAAAHYNGGGHQAKLYKAGLIGDMKDETRKYVSKFQNAMGLQTPGIPAGAATKGASGDVAGGMNQRGDLIQGIRAEKSIEDKAPGFFPGVVTATKNSLGLNNFYETANDLINGFDEVDPEFKWNRQTVAMYMADLPDNMHARIREATNDKEAVRLREKALAEVESNKVLNTLGVGSKVVGSLLATLPDPTNLLPMTLVGKAGVIANIAAGAAVYGGSEYLANEARLTPDDNSPLMMAAVGGALGAFGAAFARGPLADIGQEIAVEGGNLTNMASKEVALSRAVPGTELAPAPLEGTLVEPLPSIGVEREALPPSFIDAEPGSWREVGETPELPGPRSIEGPQGRQAIEGPTVAEPIPEGGPVLRLEGPKAADEPSVPVQPEGPVVGAPGPATVAAPAAPKAPAGSRTLPELDITDATIPKAEFDTKGILRIPMGLTDPIGILKYVAKNSDLAIEKVVAKSMYAFYKKYPKFLEVRTGVNFRKAGVQGQSFGSTGGAGVIAFRAIRPTAAVMLHEMMHGSTNFIRNFAEIANGSVFKDGTARAAAVKAVDKYNKEMKRVLELLETKAVTQGQKVALDHIRKASMGGGDVAKRGSVAARKGDEVSAYILNPGDEAIFRDLFELASQVTMPNRKKSALSAIGKALAGLLGFGGKGVSAVEALLDAQANLAKANDVFLKETKRALKAANGGKELLSSLNNDLALVKALGTDYNIALSPAADVLAAWANSVDESVVLNAIPKDYEALRGIVSKSWGVLKQFSVAREAVLITSQKSAAIKELSLKLFNATRGGIGLQATTAADVQLKLYESSYGKVARGFRDAFDELLERDKIPSWKQTQRYEEVSAELAAHRLGVKPSNDPLVLKMNDALTAHYNDMVDHINNPGLTQGETKLGMYNRMQRDAKGQVVIGADGKPVMETVPLQKDPSYQPIHHDAGKWDEVAAKYGKPVLEQFFAKAFAKARQGVPKDVAEAFGRFYVATQLAAKNLTDNPLDMVLESASADVLRAKLTGSGTLSPKEVEALVEALETHGQIANKNLKARAKYDTSTTLTLPDGTSLDLTKLIDTRQLEVADMYTRRMSGTIALADRVGAYTDADMERLIQEATQAEFGSGVSKGQVAQSVKYLRDAVQLIQGKPMEELSSLSITAQIFRSIATAAYMTMSALNQLAEFGRVVGTLGIKATLSGFVPALKEMRMVAKGKPDSWFRELYDFVGGPADSLFTTHHNLEAFKGFQDMYGSNIGTKTADAIAGGTETLARVTMVGLGMVPLMRFQSRLVMTGMVNKWAQAAIKGGKWDYTAARLETAGVSAADQTKIMDAFKSYAKMSGDSVKDVDWTAWRTADPKSFGVFTTFLKRESRRMVQENDIGSSFPVMDSTFGKTMFQFWNFGMNAHSKHMVHMLNHRDTMAVKTLVSGVVFNTLSFYAKTGIKSINKEDREAYLDETLTFDKLVRYNLAMMPELGLTTSVAFPLVTGKDLQSERFQAPSDTLFRPAALSIVDSIGTGVRLLGPGPASQEDMNLFLRGVPGANLPGIGGALNTMTSDLPTRREIDEQDELALD